MRAFVGERMCANVSFFCCANVSISVRYWERACVHMSDRVSVRFLERAWMCANVRVSGAFRASAKYGKKNK